MENTSRRIQNGTRIVNEPYLSVRIDHSFAPYEHGGACQAIADIVTRRCFEPLKDMELETLQGETVRHGPLTADAFLEFFASPKCDVVCIDSGRRGPYIAAARISTGRSNKRYTADVAPAASSVILPRNPALEHARIDAFCALAAQLHAIAGCISMEPDMGMAMRLTNGTKPPPLARALELPGFTERRVRERDAYSAVFRTLDQELPGPEWGLFLSRGHLARLPAPRIEDTGVFARVQRLGDDLVYIQLTDDPMDTLRDDYDEMLDRARDVLAPILMDVSGIVID